MEPKKRDYKFYADDTSRMGRMNDPSVASVVEGGCGDTQELYLIIKDDFIEEARFFATGCEATHACGAYVAEWIEGVTVSESLTLSAGDILSHLKGIPEGHHHCAILAMLTLYQAIGNYMLTPKY